MKCDNELREERERTANKSHYFSAYCSTSKNKNKHYHCDYCLKGWQDESKLKHHLMMSCASVTTCKPVMPKEGVNDVLKFKNHHNSIKAPYDCNLLRF